MQNVIRNHKSPITFNEFYYEAVVNQKVEYFNAFDEATMNKWYNTKSYKKLDSETLMTQYMKLRKGLLVAELALLQSFLLKREIPVGNS